MHVARSRSCQAARLCPAPARSRVGPLSLRRGLWLLLAVAPLLSACGSSGFRPLYGPTPNGEYLQDRLRGLDVAPIPGRIGQRIRNELIFQASGGGELQPPTYRLEVTTTESVQSTLADTTGATAGGAYNLQASFKLVRLKDKKVVLQGTSYGRAAFERFTDTTTPTGTAYVYSNVRAREDSENRAAQVVADDLKTRVAIYLSGAD
jgi:LPS-assembly lipoprotein